MSPGMPQLTKPTVESLLRIKNQEPVEEEKNEEEDTPEKFRA